MTSTERRVRIPLTIKVRSALIALGFDPDAVEFHHDPPLKMRPWNPIIGDYEPAANDPWHIVPMAAADHRARTAAIDAPAIAKTRRLTKAELEFRNRVLMRNAGMPRAPSKWPSRPFRRKAK